MVAKIGRVLDLDISQKTGRITALEALAATILNTPEETLKAETEGGHIGGDAFKRERDFLSDCPERYLHQRWVEAGNVEGLVPTISAVLFQEDGEIKPYQDQLSVR